MAPPHEQRQFGTAVAEYVLPETGLAASLVALAKQHSMAIAVAESCTGGTIAQRLTAIPGASAVLREGLVVYTEAAKTARLGVSPEIIADAGVVSAAVAGAMADGLMLRHNRRGGFHNAIATTGFAGPAGGTAADPVGTVYVGVVVRRAGQQQTSTERHVVRGDRHHIIARAAARASCKILAEYFRNV